MVMFIKLIALCNFLQLFIHATSFVLKFSSAVHLCDLIRAKIFFSCSSAQPHPCKNFLQLCIPATASVQNFCSAVHPCDLICKKIFFSRSPMRSCPCIPCGQSVSHPFACCAFSHTYGYLKKCFCVRGHKFKLKFFELGLSIQRFEGGEMLLLLLLKKVTFLNFWGPYVQFCCACLGVK